MTRKNGRRWFDGYLIFLAAMLLGYGVYTAHSSRSWSISDWLINYQGGFVRRGLPGEVFFLLGRGLHLSPVVLVIVTCFALYAVLLLCVRRLARDCSWDVWVIALLVSPATLAFPILDLSAGFRKEILYLAGLALLLVLLRQRRIRDWQLSVFLSVALGVETLSHEPLFCFAPYLLAALVLAGYAPTRAMRIFLVPGLVGVAAAYASGTHLGDTAVAEAICRSLGYPLLPPGREICAGGAIAYLGHTRAVAQRETLAVIASKQYLRMYPALALFALLPVLAGLRKLAQAGERRNLWLLGVWATISLGGSSVLFLYAEDWGRWIYIHVLSLGLLLLFLDGKNAHAAQEPARGNLGWITRAALVVYATCWSLPCAGKAQEYTQDAGYAGLVHHILLHRKAHEGS